MILSKNIDYGLARAKAKAAIDEKAGLARSAVMTSAIGQDYVYQQKLREAVEFLQDIGQDASTFHFLLSEAMVSSTTVEIAAQNIIAARDNMNAALAAIETTRRQAKQRVDAAADRTSDIQAVVTETMF